MQRDALNGGGRAHPASEALTEKLAALADLDAVGLRAEWRRLYLPRPCRSYAEAKHDSARGLRPHRETHIGPYRGEQPMSVTTVDAGCSANREENK